MNPKDLYQLINSLSTDIEFDYAGGHGFICPFSRSNISIGFLENEKTCTSVDEAMSAPIFNGKSLNEVSGSIEIY